MRISGTDPSSVIRSAEAKRDGVINPKNYNFSQFYTQKKICFWNAVDRRTWLHVPLGTLWSTNSDTHQVAELQ